MRMEEENKVKRTMKMDVGGTEAKGRPRTMWMNNIRRDMNKRGLEEGDVQDGRKWRRMAQKPNLAF